MSFAIARSATHVTLVMGIVSLLSLFFADKSASPSEVVSLRDQFNAFGPVANQFTTGPFLFALFNSFQFQQEPFPF